MVTDVLQRWQDKLILGKDRVGTGALASLPRAKPRGSCAKLRSALVEARLIVAENYTAA
jgi:hypothetical protein